MKVEILKKYIHFYYCKKSHYIFINEKYFNNQWDIEITSDQISKNFSDHYPIDFWIKM